MDSNAGSKQLEPMMLRMTRDKKLSDVLEALTGAVMLTCGFKTTVALLHNFKILQTDYLVLSDTIKMDFDNV